MNALVLSEFEAAVKLANKIRDRPGCADPDDDLAVLSRQFLRAVDRENAYTHGAEWIDGCVKAAMERKAAEDPGAVIIRDGFRYLRMLPADIKVR
jgi:hypothetical protein